LNRRPMRPSVLSPSTGARPSIPVRNFRPFVCGLKLGEVIVSI
jgi:hypothetical protein